MDVVLDIVRGETQQHSLSVLKPGGIILWLERQTARVGATGFMQCNKSAAKSLHKRGQAAKKAR
jgi:hypothetical protein